MNLFGWMRKQAEPELKPGICECDHERCYHVKGKGECTVGWPDDGFEKGFKCACEIYIRDDDSGGGEDSPEPTDPAVEELERLSKLK